MTDQLKNGDKVRFSGKEGVVVNVDYGVDRIVVDVTEANGGSNMHYGHISQFKPELVEPAQPLDAEDTGKHAKSKATPKVAE